jgi:cell division protein FtsL
MLLLLFAGWLIAAFTLAFIHYKFRETFPDKEMDQEN